MLKVLIVDDEENTRLALSRYLSGQSCQIAAATDGGTALRQLNHQSFDLVITDINMPGMNGLQFLDQMMHRHPAVPVIMMTAYAGIDSYLQSKNLGAFEYLVKPVRLADLKTLIDHVKKGKLLH